MENIRRLGGGAGILAGVAAAWFFIGLVVVFPVAGLGLHEHGNPHAVIPFLAKHQVMYWLVNVLGGFLSAFMTLILLLGLGDRFREEAPAPSQIGVAAGIVGVIGFGISALLNQIGYSSLIPLNAANKTVAATAWYAVKGTADSFMTLGGVSLGISALVFGNVMLKANRYGHIGYLSVVTGTPLILSGFISHVLLFMIASILNIAWLCWTGVVMWLEAAGVPQRQPQRRVANPTVASASQNP
jgi:hypothetical protein